MSAAGRRIGARGWRRARLALRALAAALLALTALGVLERSPFARPQYALVLDDSPSVRRRFPGFAEEALERWREFDGGAHPVVRAAERPLPEGADGGGTRFTDLPAALLAAARLGDPRVETRILLVTDGLTRGDGVDEAAGVLRERGAKVWALAPPQPVAQQRVVALVLPERVFLWEPFTVRVRVQASRPGPVRVQLARDGAVVAEAAVTVDASGVGDVEFPQELERVGRARYAAAIPGDKGPGAAGEVGVAQSPRVRWLTEDAAAAGPLVGFFRGRGIDVELTNPAELTFPEQELSRDEVFVLDDVPAPALTEPLVEALRQAVARRGAGLVVLGGRKGLGSDGYAGTAVEGMLPVTAGFRSPPPPESVAMVLAFDTSFSMAFRGRGVGGAHGSEPRKIDLAKESAREVVRIVRGGDRLGILGNSDEVFWISPLGAVADPEAVAARVDQVRPVGGGIFFYSVLAEARRALRDDPAGVRHVLVLCDSEDIDQYEVAGVGHSFDLLRDMSREGITVSILAIGTPADKDVPFLRTAALLGGGDFYLVSRIAAMPRYFVSEYRRLSSARNVLEEEVQAVVSEQSPAGADVTEAYPALSGMALVTPRDGTRTLLQSTVGAPLLVTGEYGRGRTAVFAADNGYRWAGRWVDAATTRRFWLQLLFRAAPAGESVRGFASLLEAERDGGRPLFHYRGADAALPAWDALWVVPADGAADAPLRLDRVGLRTYRGAGAALPEGFRLARVAEQPDGSGALLTAGYTVPPADEDLASAPRWDVVERLFERTGGGWVDRPEELTPPPRLADRIGLPPGALAAAAAVALLLVELAVRTFREE